MKAIVTYKKDEETFTREVPYKPGSMSWYEDLEEYYGRVIDLISVVFKEGSVELPREEKHIIVGPRQAVISYSNPMLTVSLNQETWYSKVFIGELKGDQFKNGNNEQTLYAVYSIIKDEVYYYIGFLYDDLDYSQLEEGVINAWTLVELASEFTKSSAPLDVLGLTLSSSHEDIVKAIAKKEKFYGEMQWLIKRRSS